MANRIRNLTFLDVHRVADRGLAQQKSSRRISMVLSLELLRWISIILYPGELVSTP
jgi:hypothetical protein